MTKTIVVTTQARPDEQTEEYEFELREGDGWYLDVGDGMEPFAHPDANERMVRQLIRKELDALY